MSVRSLRETATLGLARGRDAYARSAWEDARAAFAGEPSLEPGDLERLGWASALSGHYPESAAAFESLYDLQKQDRPRGARIALWLSLQFAFRGEQGKAGGWFTRAQRLLEREERCVEHGYLAVPIAQQKLAACEWEAAAKSASAAAEIGDRFADADLAAYARVMHGRALLAQGRIADGLALLDDAMVSITSGKVAPLVTGISYCGAISACQQVYALGRAREWAGALIKWCDAQPQLAMFAGNCIVHRAALRQLAGAWPAALADAERVTAAHHPAPVRADAFYQLAEVHRLRGEDELAEKAYRRANDLGRETQPGLSLLRLAQGKHAAARSGIQRALAAAQGPLLRAKFLPAAVEASIAAGQLEEARGASAELLAIAGIFATDALLAMAAQASGAVALAEGDAKAAQPPLRAAFAGWQVAGAPYSAARVRVLLASACKALGDEDGTELELSAARATLERLGAAPGTSALQQPAASRTGLSARELEVLRLVASGKTNKQIAAQLFISEKTVDRHLSNLFDKTGVRTRAGVTAVAYERKLV